MTTTETESTDTTDPLVQLAQLRNEEREKDRIVYGNYRTIVRLIGDRKTVPMARISEVLAAADKSVAQLDQAVQVYLQRKRITDQIAAAQAGAQKKPALVKSLEVEVKKFRAAEAAFHKVADPIAWEIEGIDQAVHEAKTAEKELRGTFDDPFAIAEMQEIDRSVRAIKQRQATIEDMISRVTTDNDLASPDSRARRMAPKERAEETKAAKHRLAELNAEMAGLKSQETKLVERSNELAKLRLIP